MTGECQNKVRVKVEVKGLGDVCIMAEMWLSESHEKIWINHRAVRCSPSSAQQSHE